MNASKFATAATLGTALLLGGCSLSNTTPSPAATPTAAMMEKETPAMTTKPTTAMLKPEEVTGATVIGGKVVLIGKDGRYELMSKNEVAIGAAKVMADGKVIGQDGSVKVLEEGMTVDVRGIIKAIDTKTIIDAKRQLMIPQEGNIEPGAYQDYAPAKLAWAKTGKVVLFFKASWCPTCKALDADIIGELKQIPGNVKILRVDYDTSAELKSKYGVTYQHTMVQVDADGKLLKKWSGSPTLEALLGETI